MVDSFCFIPMATSHASLDAAANERKARLAKLKSLKRKRPDLEHNGADEAVQRTEIEESSTTSYLSGRNYDISTRGPKLGFEQQPDKDQATLEKQAEEIADATRRQAKEEAEADKPIDLFKLQPKKPNWDLKRDVERKLERLNVQTDNAIAKMVRERIAAQKKLQPVSEPGGGQAEDGDGDGTNVEGNELLESVHLREQEAAEESVSSEESEEE